MLDLRGNVKVEENGNIIIEVPELSCVLKVTKSYYLKHMTRMENDKTKVQNMLFPPQSTPAAQPAQPAS